MLGVSDGVADDVLEEDLEDTACLFVNEARDTFHPTTTSETSDSLVDKKRSQCTLWTHRRLTQRNAHRFGDALNVIA
jgi:hypothetical protein